MSDDRLLLEFADPPAGRVELRVLVCTSTENKTVTSAITRCDCSSCTHENALALARIFFALARQLDTPTETLLAEARQSNAQFAIIGPLPDTPSTVH